MEDNVMEIQQERERAIEYTRVYRRDLPGAGFVAIELSQGDASADDGSVQDTPRVRISVERRGSESRRVGHTPPVVAEIDGDDTAADIGELYRVAADNVALARALIEWQTRRKAVADD
jgi:hypothetical protein